MKAAYIPLISASSDGGGDSDPPLRNPFESGGALSMIRTDSGDDGGQGVWGKDSCERKGD